MEDIDAGLVALVATVKERGIRSIAIPPLGSGLGGLEWSQVRPRIEQAFAALPDVNVIIYEPAGAPSAKEMVSSSEVPNMTAGRAALVGLMNQYLSGLLDPFVTLLELHKLMYFMQEAGEPLQLDYVKAPYGPYAQKLRYVLRRVEGHFISGYADGGDAPDKQLELVPGAVLDAQAKLEDAQDTRARFDRVADLVAGYESPFGLELLATVHWVATRANARTLDDVMDETYGWGDRKRQFSPAQLEQALGVLQAKGWIGDMKTAA
jgi:O-acetyl-ADP-ribose deacetylase (regulator of RNase III)